MPAKLNLTDEERKTRRTAQRKAQCERYRIKHPLTEEQKENRAAKQRVRHSTVGGRAAKNASQQAWRAKNPHKVKEYNDKVYAENPEYKRESARKSYWKNHDSIISKNKIKYAENRQYHIDRVKEWAKKNPEKKRVSRNNCNKKRYDSDPTFKIICSLRGRLSKVLRLQGLRKCASTENLLGCSIGHFMEYLKAHFKPGMTFNNYGQWHIDHRKPCAKFNLTEPEEQRACFNWLNLQPLWAKENLSKNDRFDLPDLQPA